MGLEINNNTLSGLVASISNIALLWFGSSLVIRQELSIGALLAFNAMNGNLTNFISTVVNFLDEYVHAKNAINRIMEVITEPLENENENEKHHVKIFDDDSISFTHVSFKHIGRTNNILNDLSLTIPGGQVTVIWGASGCGKSTL